MLLGEPKNDTSVIGRFIKIKIFAKKIKLKILTFWPNDGHYLGQNANYLKILPPFGDLFPMVCISQYHILITHLKMQYSRF